MCRDVEQVNSEPFEGGWLMKVCLLFHRDCWLVNCAHSLSNLLPLLPSSAEVATALPATQVKVSNTSELDALLDASAYEKKCEEGGGDH